MVNVWASEWKSDVAAKRLLVEKFAKHVVFSAYVYFGAKGKLHFVAVKAKISTKYYIECLLPHLINDCKKLLQNRFILQQDGSAANTANLAQEWFEENSMSWVHKERWLAAKFAGFKSVRLRRTGNIVRTVSTLHSKTKVYRKA